MVSGEQGLLRASLCIFKNLREISLAHFCSTEDLGWIAQSRIYFGFEKVLWGSALFAYFCLVASSHALSWLLQADFFNFFGTVIRARLLNKVNLWLYFWSIDWDIEWDIDWDRIVWINLIHFVLNSLTFRCFLAFLFRYFLAARFRWLF